MICGNTYLENNEIIKLQNVTVLSNTVTFLYSKMIQNVEVKGPLSFMMKR